MSVIKVNNITSRDGTTGPVIAGIATVSTTSHFVVPTGNTGQKVPLAPDPFINNLVLALPFNSESVFDDVSPRNQGTFSGRGSVGFATTTASLPFGVSGVTTTSVGIVTFSKYYGTSVGFNTSISSTQALQNISTADYQFGGQDFTVECWVYVKNFVANDYGVIVKSSTDSSWLTGWTLYHRSNSRFGWYLNGTGVDGQSYSGGTETLSTYSTGTWYHLAVVRRNFVRSFYVNGILDRSDTDLVNYIPTSIISIGNDISSNFRLDGYLQDLRIYKGVAKYTSNFTPPTQIAL
jgi:hypothetical protein